MSLSEVKLCRNLCRPVCLSSRNLSSKLSLNQRFGGRAAANLGKSSFSYSQVINKMGKNVNKAVIWVVQQKNLLNHLALIVWISPCLWACRSRCIFWISPSCFSGAPSRGSYKPTASEQMQGLQFQYYSVRSKGFLIRPDTIKLFLNQFLISFTW